MKVEIRINQIFEDGALSSFLMRKQSRKKLDELVSYAKDWRAVLDVLEYKYDEFEELEEDLYSMGIGALMDVIGEEYFNIDDEEDDEEEEEEEEEDEEDKGFNRLTDIAGEYISKHYDNVGIVWTDEQRKEIEKLRDELRGFGYWGGRWATALKEIL